MSRPETAKRTSAKGDIEDARRITP
jgi:hypothetical protein